MTIVMVLVLALLAALPAAAEQGVTDTEVVIGCSTSFSGPMAFAGEQATRFGVDLWLRVVNEAGGVHGRRIKTVYLDDGYWPRDALANTRTLVEQEGVFAIVAPLGASPVAATLPFLEERKVPLLFPLHGMPVTRGRRYVFGGAMLHDRESRVMIDYLTGPRKFRRFAALYQDDEHGRAFLAALRKDLGRHRLALVAAEPVSPGAFDVSAQVARLQAARPEVTFLVLTPGPGTQALAERRKIGWTDTLMVSVGPLTDERYLALAGEAAEGVEGLALWPDPVTSDLPGVVRYREHMKAHFPQNQPNRHSLSGYVAAMLFTEGARRAGRALTREGLIAALEGITGWESGILPPLTIGPDHETRRQGLWVRMERGRFKALTDWLGSE